MMTSRHLLSFAAALLICLHATARATTLAADPSHKPSTAQPQTVPIFSLGTISIAPSQQSSASASTAGAAPKSRRPRRSRSAHPSRRFVQPVPLRIYSRA